MGLFSDFLNKITISKLTKKTWVSLIVIFLHFFNRIDEINIIIQILLYTIVFICIKSFYISQQLVIDLENSTLKNCIGMLTIITLLRKTSFIGLPDSIIKSINSFISNTNVVAENLMDGSNVNPNVNTNIDVIKEINLLSTNDLVKQQSNSIEKIIFKSILEKFIAIQD